MKACIGAFLPRSKFSIDREKDTIIYSKRRHIEHIDICYNLFIFITFVTLITLSPPQFLDIEHMLFIGYMLRLTGVEVV